MLWDVYKQISFKLGLITVVIDSVEVKGLKDLDL